MAAGFDSSPGDASPSGDVSPRLILASASPRRAQLLAMLGLRFEIVPSGIPEEGLHGETPAEHARGLAEKKALAVAASHPNALVIGSDTIVVIDGEIVNKPEDEEDAVGMLMRLQGREHEVHTGVAVVETGGRRGTRREEPAVSAGMDWSVAQSGAFPTIGLPLRRASGTESVRVRFRPFDEATARAYVATGEPMDKAGAYGIQGYGATLVEKIDGDFFAVMGLPVVRLLRLLEELGYRYDFRGLERG